MKYLFVDSASSFTDSYSKLIFEEKFCGNITELWEKVYQCDDHLMNYTLVYEDDPAVEKIELILEADNLDEYTVNKMQELIDYDTQKSYGWIKAE